MTPLEALMQAALTAPADRQHAALRVLLGQADVTDSNALAVRHEPYLTLAALSKATGISTSTLWRWRVSETRSGEKRRDRW